MLIFAEIGVAVFLLGYLRAMTYLQVYFIEMFCINILSQYVYHGNDSSLDVSLLNGEFGLDMILVYKASEIMCTKCFFSVFQAIFWCSK